MTRSGTAENGFLALKERKQLMDDVWLLALFVLFVAVSVPWYLRLLDIEFAPVAWSLFAFGAVYLLASAAADRLRSQRSLLIVVNILQTGGIVFLGYVWYLAGGLQNPLFLLIFVLPVVAGSFVLLSWQSYAGLLLSVATVLTVAVLGAPELRWYASQFAPAARGLVEMLPLSPPSQRLPFPGLSVPPAYLFVVLIVFTVLLLTVSLMTEALTSLLRRLYRRLEVTASALNVAEDLSSEVLRFSPWPAVLVHADTLRVRQASQSFLQELFLTPDSLLEKDLLALVEFAHPEVIRELIASGGEAPLALYQVDGESRAARVRVSLLNQGGRRYAYLTLEDLSEMQRLSFALDAMEQPVVVVGARQTVAYFNRSAVEAFPGLETGADADAVLAATNLPRGWWELGMRARQERTVEAAGRRFSAVCVGVRFLGASDSFTVVTLRPVGGAVL